MNIFKFTANFTNEESCLLHYKEEKDKQGVTCKRCSSKDHYWLKGKWSYQCKSCKFRTSLRSDNIERT